MCSGMHSNYASAQPIPFRIYRRKKSNCASDTSDNERDAGGPDEKYAYTKFTKRKLS